jgi:hypothetical protein
MNLLRLQLISSFFPWSSHFSSSEGFVFRYWFHNYIILLCVHNVSSYVHP